MTLLKKHGLWMKTLIKYTSTTHFCNYPQVFIVPASINQQIIGVSMNLQQIIYWLFIPCDLQFEC